MFEFCEGIRNDVHKLSSYVRLRVLAKHVAKGAGGAIVSIIMSDKDGRPIAQGTGFLIDEDIDLVNLCVEDHDVLSLGL